MLTQQSVIFEAPYSIAVKESSVPEPGAGMLLVEAAYSAISSGTEMLFYRGQIPEAMAVDATIEALDGEFSYPLAYGYALAGTITAVGPQGDDEWLGKKVFVFSPHQSHVVCRVADVIPVPEGVSLQKAVLLPFMETAVSFLMDGLPMIGERAVVFGQGIIGLLSTLLLAGCPLSRLVTVDPIPLRREYALKLGARQALDPHADDFSQQLYDAINSKGSSYLGADLVYELSGNPETLNQAIECAGFNGRIVVGSWYGRKNAPLDLGGHFHRSQINIVSSQVSHFAPQWTARFDKARRMQVAWQKLANHQPESLISHRFPISQAAEAYRLLDQAPQTAIQVVLDYGSAAG